MNARCTSSSAVAGFAAKAGAVMERWEVLGRGSTVVAAVSGGLDSTLLLWVLKHLADANDWRLLVAHFNHRLRGFASDGDQAFVEAVARDLNLPIHLGGADVAAESVRAGVSLEMAARELRHEFLPAPPRKTEPDSLPWGIMRMIRRRPSCFVLLRGSAGLGLGCMSAVAPSPMSSEVRLLRPFLGFPKSELESVAAAADMAFRTDDSNSDLSIPRNLVRAKLLPAIRKDMQPAIASVLTRTAALLGDQADFVRSACLDWLDDPSQIPFHRLHTAVQRDVVYFQLVSLGAQPDFEHVEHLRLTPSQTLNLPGGLLFQRSPDGLISTLEPVHRQPDPQLLEVALVDRPFDVAFGGLRLSLVPSEERVPPAEGRECFDADAIGANFTLRHRQPGDRFAPIGLGSSALLQDLLVNARIPYAERDRLVLACNAWGEIFWVEGLRIGEIAKVTPETTRFTTWQWHRSA